MLHGLAIAALLAWTLGIAVMDIRQRRIANASLLAAWVPGLLVFAFRDTGWLGQPLAASALGLGMTALFLLPGFVLGAMGGGDVKFAAVCGWYVGPLGSLLMLLTMAGVLGFTALGRLWLDRRRPAGTARMPAAPAIAAGFWLVVLGGVSWVAD